MRWPCSPNPRVSISARIPAMVRCVRDGGGGSPPDSEDSQTGAGLTVVWMTAVILSHIFVLGYGSVLAAKMVLKSNSSTSASTEMRRW